MPFWFVLNACTCPHRRAGPTIINTRTRRRWERRRGEEEERRKRRRGRMIMMTVKKKKNIKTNVLPTLIALRVFNY